MKQAFLEYLLKNMSLSEKIGQLIMIDYRDTLEMNAELENILTKYSPGGFILFKSNIANFEETKKLLTGIKQASDIPIIVSTDQEGGRVQRLDERVGFEKYPPMSEIGKTKNSELAFEIGKKMGQELKSIGVNMDMAPILDIFSNPQNKVIADRSFGSDSKTVNEMAFPFANGLKEAGIIPVGKHFPGHGDTAKDSHVDLPIVEKDLDELKQLELLPFIEAVRQKLPGLMIGHIAVPKITKDYLPASLSKVMISDLLKKDIGYQGLVIPDSLKMKALSKYFTNKDIYLRCLQAGNDMLLMPQDINEAYNTIYRAVNEGKIDENTINNKVLKILSMKFDYGFFDKQYQEFIKNNQSKKR